AGGKGRAARRRVRRAPRSGAADALSDCRADDGRRGQARRQGHGRDLPDEHPTDRLSRTRARTERALVIGSGPNGLAAAITLAQAGCEVLVLEAASAPGGAVATEELTLPGFKHDTYSSVYPAAVASPVLAAMPLERHGLRWVHPLACYAHPLEDGR